MIVRVLLDIFDDAVDIEFFILELRILEINHASQKVRLACASIADQLERFRGDRDG